MAKKKEDKLVVNQIIIKAPQRKTSDVGTWRAALQSADSGRVKALYDLYEDLLIDGVLSDAMQKRIDAVTNSELTYQDKNGKEVPELTALIDTPAMEDLLTQIMHHRFWGRAGMEFDFTDGLKVYPLPAKHINLVNKQILLNEFDTTGVPYENDDHLLILGKKNDFGLFLKTAPYAIWKRGGFGDYAQWLELFGMPQRVGKYSSYDAESRRLLEEALEKSGSAPWVVIPKDSEVETVNNTGSGTGAPYNDFRKACNEEILITILGQTMTTVQGDKGARALGEVHKEVEEGKNRSDLRFVQRVLNYFVLPILQKRGYSVGEGGGFVFPKAAEALKVSEIVQLSDILDIPASFLHEKYAIPVAQDGEILARKKQSSEPEPPADPPADPPAPGKKKVKKPKAEKIENADKSNFLKNLWDFFVQAPEAGAASLSKKLKGNTEIELADKYKIDFNALFIAALKEIHKQETELFSIQLFNTSNDAMQHAFDSEFKKETKEWGKENGDFLNEFKTNGAVFSAFKAHTQTKAIVDLLLDDNGNLRSFNAFKKLALPLSKNHYQHWLQTEYNTAVRSARAAVNFRKYLKTKKLYPNLEYIESTSAVKRDAHLHYVGTILPIEHPWWDTHLPPSDWNCGCGVRPTDKEVTAVPGEELVNPVFANNSGKNAEFVNIKQTPYYKSTAAADRKKIEKMAKKLQNGN